MDLSFSVECNKFDDGKNLPEINAINKHKGTDHGITIIAITAIDKKNAHMTLKIKVSEEYLSMLFDGLWDTWMNYQAEKIKIKTYRVDGDFKQQYKNTQLDKKQSHVFPTDAYPIIIDIEQDTKKY